MKDLAKERLGMGVLRWYPLILLVLVLVLLGFNTSHGQSTGANKSVWVSVDGNDETGTGTFADPFETINFGILQANSWDTVVVMPGEYQEFLNFDYYGREVHLVSYKGSEVTIINAIGEAPALNYTGFTGLAPILLEGFTIKNGYPHGIQIQTWDVIIRNCIIEACSTASGEFSIDGGAIYVSYSLGEIDHCTFRNNWAARHGGAIYSSFSAVKIFDCLFEQNSAEGGNGGAIAFNSMYDGDHVPIVANNVIRGNSAPKGIGGGVSVSGYDYVHNNLIIENAAGAGGGVGFTEGNFCQLYNNIIMNNGGGGLYCFVSVDGFAGNNCFFGNTGYDLAEICNDDGGNIFADPLFVDYAGGDYHLSDQSPCINAGRNIDSLIDVDFDNQKRIIQNTVDIGPDEFADCNLVSDFSANPTTGCQFMLVTFDAQVEGRYDSLYWDFGDGTFAVNAPKIYKSYDSLGTFTVTLHASTPCTTVIAAKEDLIVVADYPNANFSASVDSGCAPLSVQFNDLSTGGAEEWHWDFGDGATSTEPDPVHEYTEGGLYTVTMSVGNECRSDTIIVRDFINVQPNAVADFTADPSFGPAPLVVNFVNNSLNDPLEFLWDFGDGTSSTEEEPTHEYTAPGVYDVWLAAVNHCETWDTLLIQDCIKVAGFNVNLVDSTHERFSKNFRFSIDTLFGSFDKAVSLRTVKRTQPERGSYTIQLDNTTMNTGDTSNVNVSLTKDLSGGTYEFALIAKSIEQEGESVLDTLLLDFYSSPMQLIAISVDSIVFDSTQVDSTAEYRLRIQNTSALADQMELAIESITIEGATVFNASPTSIVVPPGPSSVEIRVTFAPVDTTRYDATMTIYSDDPVSPENIVYLTGLGIPERVLPYVTYTEPEGGTQAVLISSTIDIYLSEGIDTLNSPIPPVSVISGVQPEGVPGSIEYITSLPHGWIVRFTPDDVFPPLSAISATVSGDVVDAAGNNLDGDRDGIAEGSPDDDFVFGFTTGPGVFPGDANNDGVVNEIDVLPLGVFWMMTGPERADGFEWMMHPAYAWDEIAATYADCNGDSTINELDLQVIGMNWGRTHSWGSPTFQLEDYDMRQHRGAFESIYFALGSNPDNEFAQKVMEVILKYVSIEAGPDQFLLSQNFPNPFNPNTYIQYNLPSDCHVTLSIHNILGQTVATLLDENQSAGSRRVMWDGRSDAGDVLPSGIYFYRLNACGFSQVKKMIMLR